MKTKMDIQEQLKREAIGLGLCQQWQGEWGKPDLRELCRKFIRGIDFCIKNDFPKVSEIRSLFNADDLSIIENEGIYINDGESRGCRHIVAMDKAIVDVYVPDYEICDIYVRHQATVRLHLASHSYAYVTLLDNCQVYVVYKSPSAQLKASYYGGTNHNSNLFDTIHYKK